jgi:hypothetical protein
MKTPYSIVTRILMLVLLTSAYGQEPIRPLRAEWTSLGIITGFHHAFDKQNHFEVRLLEADGSATVALNPIAMYVVITNNSSAADLQQYVWRLPHGVRNVKRVRLVGLTLRIRAELDADPFDPSKSVGRELNVRYSVSNGVLNDTLWVSEEAL